MLCGGASPKFQHLRDLDMKTPSSKPVWATYQVQSQLELHSERLSQKTKPKEPILRTQHRFNPGLCLGSFPVHISFSSILKFIILICSHLAEAATEAQRGQHRIKVAQWQVSGMEPWTADFPAFRGSLRKEPAEPLQDCLIKGKNTAAQISPRAQSLR